MPNWCSTTYRFRGDQNEIKLLRDKITEWTSAESTKSSEPKWLGNILIGAGFKDRIDNADPAKDIRCRGSICDISDINHDGTRSDQTAYSFTVDTETAWCPMAKMWNCVIDALKLKTVGFTFIAEETGCQIYWIYDPNGYNDFTDENVKIDSYGSPETNSINGYYSENDAVDILNEFFKTTFSNINDFWPLCNKYNDEHDCSRIYVHVFNVDNELQS
jgi:hypothetical protein